MPVVHDIWDLRGTTEQNRIIEATLDRVDFPWHWLRPGLVASVGRSTIPVDWADLSRYADDLVEGTEIDTDHHDDVSDDESHDHHDHDHDEKHTDDAVMFSQGPRMHGTDKDFHVIGYRNRVLGLAWYSGRVTLEQSLVSEPELAGEVFMSEGAHMVDFFYMTDEMRAGVWNAFHPDHQDVDITSSMADGHEVHHGHSWFDVGGYYSWVGEAFMGGFVKAFSDLPVTIEFDHPATDEAAKEIREVFGLGTPEEPEVEEPVVEPEEAPFFGIGNSKVFHDSHKRIPRHVVWESYQEAVDAGRRPCKVCKPKA